MLRLLTAGESHGEALVAILEGMPSNLRISTDFINQELKRRQHFFGRGKRQEIEQDTVKILSGVIKGRTAGGPISLIIKNRDFSIDKLPSLSSPRPGHADLTGVLKYNLKDIGLVLERSSARETATRVAIGAICKELLLNFGVEIFSYVLAIGKIEVSKIETPDKIRALLRNSLLNCPDKKKEQKMLGLIENIRARGDTLGGCFGVVAKGVCVGLGSFSQPDRRLSARLPGALMSIPAIKAVEIGNGISSSKNIGSNVHDEIFYTKQKGFFRKTNHSGGIEGGITTGEPIVLRCYMKPISTLMKPLISVDIITKKPKRAEIIRSDVCAVPSAGIVAEAVVSYILADAYLEKFGSDSLEEMKRNFKGYLRQLKNF
ncbi:MAG: chorismate synthase [Candidatus Omnitrophica bacterium]|nr:chorismate synthase [Candidatus Omnitrophota bacterium]